MTLDDIVLSDDLEWSDENEWSPIEQIYEYSATGALLIQESTKLTGRKITLTGIDNMAWITRPTLTALIAKRNQIGLKMTLTINGIAHNVMFRQSEVPIDVTPLLRGDFFATDSYYTINALRFMEVPI